MRDESITRIPKIVKDSFCVGVIGLLVSIGIIVLFSTTYMGGGGADVVLLFALPVLAIFPIGIVLSIKAFTKTKEIRKKQIKTNKLLTIMIVIGLVGSLSFVIAIPVAFHMNNRLVKEMELKREAQEREEEAEKEAYETEPNVVSQLRSYLDCYTYRDGINYRSARDAVCSYLRYTYSNNWQEPQNGGQLDSQKYTPKYFFESRASSDGATSLIDISEQVSKISRSSLRRLPDVNRARFLITPHRSCEKEKNDSMISVWYLDNNLYENDSTKDEQLVCLYYDYHSDTSYGELNKYENSSLNIYTDQFKDFYEKLLAMLKKRASNIDYNYPIPSDSGIILYDNAAFMSDFFADLVNI